MVGTLDRLGLAESTLVFYTADHGDAIASHGGVFDKDSLMVEETERIPLAVRWPGRVPPGVASDRLVTHMDIVPTLLEAAGADAPSPVDGRSLLPLVESAVRRTDASWPDDLLCQHHGHGHPCFQRLVCHGLWKYVAHLDDLDELYHLERDPFELRNCAEDPAMADVLRDLRHRLGRLMDTFADTAPDAQRLRHQWA